jgi:hypothetical protein
MSSNEPTGTIAVRQMPIAARIALGLLAILLIAASNLAHAVPVAPPGYGGDTGDSYFVPGSTTVAIEFLDAVEAVTLSEFGFYYRSTPGTLVPIFDAADLGAGQSAQINFGTGEVADLDTPADPVTTFAVLADDVGFYLTISGALTLHSDPALNVGVLGGADLFYAFPQIANPLIWALVFEGDLGNGGLENISLSILGPLTPSAVPLPPTVYLMGSLIPILMFMSRRRRKLAASAG